MVVLNVLPLTDPPKEQLNLPEFCIFDVGAACTELDDNCLAWGPGSLTIDATASWARIPG